MGVAVRHIKRGPEHERAHTAQAAHLRQPSHHDNAWCREFVAALQLAGWDVWYDEKGLGGGARPD